ncbi:tetrapyrrole biosynthesis, uroporphyrinogen III synthase [Ramaria rubella]|nr:tetrapyrrole biosynthesis, uroporphyrinogen III synthase [Ramaria rubella]
MSRAVILLKSPPRVYTVDAYVQHFERAGYTPYFVEVLESNFCNEKSLEDIVRADPKGSVFAGVVITSSRAADAWIQAVSVVEKPGDWSNTPFYVIGESTARTLKQITALHPTKFTEALILGASQTGKSETLAQFVLDDLPSRQTTGKLLYLTGDKNRDTFFKIMSENGVALECLMVYETKSASDLAERVALVVQEIKKVATRDQSTWLIMFAPSSSGFALPHLHKYFRLSQATPSLEPVQDSRLNARLGAIGSTTAEFLRSDLLLHVDVVPVKPAAEHLVMSICEADAK